MADSEFRMYGYILDRLQEMGWDSRSPRRGGHVLTQNEVSRDQTPS